MWAHTSDSAEGRSLCDHAYERHVKPKLSVDFPLLEIRVLDKYIIPKNAEMLQALTRLQFVLVCVISGL